MIIRPAVSNGHARPTRIERILQIVGAGGDVDAGRAQGVDRGQPARHRRQAPRPCRKRFVWGSATTFTPAAATTFGGLAAGPRRRWPRLTQWLAVAGEIEPGEHRTAQVTEPVRGRIERLVGVQIDTDAEVGGDAEEHVGGALVPRSDCRPRDAGTRRRGRRPRPCASRSNARWSAPRRPVTGQPQSATISIEIRSARRSRTVDERLDAAQPVLHGRRRRACERRRSRWPPSVGRPARPARSMSATLVRWRVAAIASIAPIEVAGRVDDALGQKRLVEMGVRLDRRRQQQPAVEIDDVRRSCPATASSVRSPMAAIVPSTMWTSTRTVDALAVTAPESRALCERYRDHVRETTTMS